MRTTVILLSTLLLLAACSAPQTRPTPEKAPQSSYPADFQSWPQVTRSEEDGSVVSTFTLEPEEGEDTSDVECRGQPDPGCGHEVYAKVTDEFGEGTVLVKDISTISEDGTKQRQLVGVMRRGRVADNGGWIFEAFEPKSGTKAPRKLVAKCANCHSFQEGNDYLFSDRDDILRATISGSESTATPSEDTEGKGVGW